MLKLPEKVEHMKKGGKILTTIMDKLLSMVSIGVTGLDLENEFDSQLKKFGVLSAFKGYEGYPYHLCIGVNDMVVHGFPSEKKLLEGDVISLDMGLIYNNYYLDMARTVVVGADVNNCQHFIDEVKRAFFASAKNARIGNKIGDMAAAAQHIIEVENDFSVVREMVGHGVGERLHMPPDVPGYGRQNTGPVLKEFQTLAVEIIAIKDKNPAIITSKDGWQTTSLSGKVCAIYENSVYVGRNGGVLLTGAEETL